ncbi:MAG: universal stress protein [Acidimicrobiales bacterium]
MKVLIAVDDTEESIDAVHLAYRTFGADADYMVVSIGSVTPIIPPAPAGMAPSYVMISELADEVRDAARAAVAAAKAELGVEAETVAAIGSPGSTICQLAEDRQVDVIVIGSHDRGIWDRLFHPSVGRHVVDKAPCSVLVVR